MHLDAYETLNISHSLARTDQIRSIVFNLFFKFRFILVLACSKNYKRHDAKFCCVTELLSDTHNIACMPNFKQIYLQIP